VWCNPPYGDDTGKWMHRMAFHNNGIALVFARTETDYWKDCVWYDAHSVLFVHGRLNFYLPDGTRATGNAGGPSALVAYGTKAAHRLASSGIDGRLVKL
jgi:hypothetical protein